MTASQPKGPIYAIGDVHGCADELSDLLRILPLTRDSVVVFLGDYVDRGTNSRGVIDVIIELGATCHVVPLMGNHEEMFLAFLDDPDSKRGAEFIMNGGSSTLANYADSRGNFTVPKLHRDFLRDLRLFHQTDSHFFVHAGVPDLPLGQVDPVKHAAFLLWSRANFLKSGYRWEKTIVHGHTPVQAVEFHDGRINVDTGCVFGRELSAVEVPSGKVYSVPRRLQPERVLLRDASSRRAAVRFDGALPVVFDHLPDGYRFETVNFSEIGMLVRQTVPLDQAPLAGGQLVQGRVGAHSDAIVRFQGLVLRRKVQQDGIYYAIQIAGDMVP